MKDNPIGSVIDVEDEPTMFKYFVKYRGEEVLFIEYDWVHSPGVHFENDKFFGYPDWQSLTAKKCRCRLIVAKADDEGLKEVYMYVGDSEGRTRETFELI